MKGLQVAVLLVLVVVGFSATEALRSPRTPPLSPPALPAAPAVPAPEQGAVAPIARPVAADPAVAASTPKPRLAVAFLLDPQVTGGIFLGNRWVSPPSWYFAQPGKRYVVRAKAQNIDSGGERTDLDGNWSTSNPQMVAIARGDGEVTITVREPGDSDMTVSAGKDVKVLHVHATQLADAMQVRITQ